MCEFQRCGKSLLWNFSSAISAVSLSSLGVRQGKAQAWSISFFFLSSSSFIPLPPPFPIYHLAELRCMPATVITPWVGLRKQCIKMLLIFAVWFLIWLDFLSAQKSYEDSGLGPNTLFVVTITSHDWNSSSMNWYYVKISFLFCQGKRICMQFTFWFSQARQTWMLFVRPACPTWAVDNPSDYKKPA